MFSSKRVFATSLARTRGGYSFPLDVVVCSTRSFLPLTGTRSSGRSTRSSRSSTSPVLYTSQYISSGVFTAPPPILFFMSADPTCSEWSVPSGAITPMRLSFRESSDSISVHAPSVLSGPAAAALSAKSSRYTFEHCPPSSSNPPYVQSFPSTNASSWP